MFPAIAAPLVDARVVIDCPTNLLPALRMRAIIHRAVLLKLSGWYATMRRRWLRFKVSTFAWHGETQTCSPQRQRKNSSSSLPSSGKPNVVVVSASTRLGARRHRDKSPPCRQLQLLRHRGVRIPGDGKWSSPVRMCPMTEVTMKDPKRETSPRYQYTRL